MDGTAPREVAASAMLVCCVAGAIYLFGCERRAALDRYVDPGGADPGTAFTVPFNASYVIDGEDVALFAGRAEHRRAPGSVTGTLTTVVGPPAFGDLDGDGDQDAGVVLLRDSGGSGGFYYLAAAVNEDRRFRGTNTVLLGDRIALGEVEIRNDVLTARFASRRRGEPMSAEPDVPRSVSAVLVGPMLLVVTGDESLREIAGRVVLGHEVRAFSPCAEEGVNYWLAAASPSFAALVDAYERSLPTDAPPYTPVFSVLSGRVVEAPEEGFGASYDAGFVVEEVVDIAAGVDCRGAAGD